MSPLRDALTTFCGSFAVFGFFACLLNGAPAWAWGVFFFVPAIGWFTFGRLWLAGMLGIFWGINS